MVKPTHDTSKAAKAAPAEAAKAAPAENTTAPAEIDTTATAAAWEQHRATFLALPVGDVVPATLDVTRAASVALAATRNVLSRSEQLRTVFREFPEERLRSVLTLALAVQHADLLHRVAQDRTSLFADILPRMTELRGILLSELETQVRRGNCTEKFLADVRAGDRDAADFANDLNDAATWFEDKIKGGLRTSVTDEEVAEARRLAARALARIASDLVTDASTKREVSTSEGRARAFTILAREYDLVRQYGAFTFWSAPGGWEQFVPSLWIGRNDGAAAVKAPPQPPQPPQPVTG